MVIWVQRIYVYLTNNLGMKGRNENGGSVSVVEIFLENEVPEASRKEQDLVGDT